MQTAAIARSVRVGCSIMLAAGWGAALACACSGTGEGALLGVGSGDRGTVVLRASGGNEARDGIAAARFADGFAVEFTHMVFSFQDFRLATALGGDAGVTLPPIVVDLIPAPVELARFEGVGAQRWDQVSFVTAPPAATPTNADNSVDPALVDLLVQNGWSGYAEGTLVAPDGRRFPFAVGLPVRIEYFNCVSGTDLSAGIVVPRSGIAETEISWHLTHLFFDSFAEASALRAEAWAASQSSGTAIDTTALATQPLAAMRGLDGQLLDDANGVPVVYIPPGAEPVDNLRDFVLRARYGHLNGLEGFCQTRAQLLDSRR